MNDRSWNSFVKIPKYEMLGLIGFMLLSLVLSLLFYSGFYGTDDKRYLAGIIALATGAEIKAVGLQALTDTRFAMIFPAAIVYYLFNGSIFITILSYTLYTPLLTLLSYVFAKSLKDGQAGLISAALVSCSPIYYYYAGSVMPDNALALWMGAAILFLIHFQRRLSAGQLNTRVEYSFILLLSCLTFLSYSVKESGLIVAVPVGLGLLLINLRHFKRLLIHISIYFTGVSLSIALESLLIYFLSGNFLFRLSIVSSQRAIDTYQMRINQQGIHPVDRFLYLIGKLENIDINLYIPLVLTIILSLFALQKKNRIPEITIIFSFLWTLLYLTIGTTNFRQYLPPPIMTRYYSVPLLFGYVISGIALVKSIAFIKSFSSKNLGGRAAVVIEVVAKSFVCLWIILNGTSAFKSNVNYAGNVESASSSRSFFNAYFDALTKSELPIVLSSFPSIRYAILMRDELDSKRINPFYKLPKNGLSDLPTPPFVFIYPNTQSRKDQVKDLILDEIALGNVSSSPFNKGTYNVPLNNFEFLKEAFYTYTSDGTIPQIVRIPFSNSYVAVIISRPLE